MEEHATLQIGIDWADQKHAFCLCAAGDDKIEHGEIGHDPVSLHQWIGKLRQRFGQGRFAVCLETSRGALVEVLRGYDFIDLYPINPITANRFRESMYPSLNKDDPMDAALILEVLRKHGERLRLLPAADPQMRLLDGLVKGRRHAVQTRTRLLQKLTATLKGYYPQALALAGELSEPLARAFLRKWPTWQDLAKARPSTLRKFYYAQRSRSESVMGARLQLHANSQPLTNDPISIELGRMEALALLDQLESVAKVISVYDQRIEEVYAKMDAKVLCDSLPGAGKVMAPRMAAAMGCHAVLCHSAQDLAAYSGVAPIRQRSGNMCRIGRRYRRPKFLYQTFLEYAHWSVRYCPWAKAYYKHRKFTLKQSHWSILRCLAFKWIRIFFRCWQTGIPYDDHAYVAQLKQHGSPLAAAL